MQLNHTNTYLKGKVSLTDIRDELHRNVCLLKAVEEGITSIISRDTCDEVSYGYFLIFQQVEHSLQGMRKLLRQSGET